MGVARFTGVLLLGFSVAGLALTALSHDAPFALLWSDQPWTAPARRAGDWAACIALGLSALALRIQPRHAVWPLALLVLLLGAMVGHDMLLADPDVTRQQAMLRRDAALAAAAALALLIGAIAVDEELERRAPDA